MFKNESSVWTACRNALVDWHGIVIQEDDELTIEWMERIEGMLGPQHKEVSELIRFATMLRRSDANHVGVGLVPQLLPLRDENSFAVFHSQKWADLLFGFDPNHTHSGVDYGPVIWGFDFDRIPDDLNPEDPGDDLGQPERFVRGANPGAFILAEVVAAYSPPGAVSISMSHREKGDFDAAIERTLGPPSNFHNIDVWSAPGLLVTQRYVQPWQVDILAMSYDACAPFDSDVMAVFGETPDFFAKLDWSGT